MNTKLIKSNIINAINKTNNPILLLEVSKLFEIDLGKEDVVYLTEEQTLDINTAISQIKNGEFLSHEDAKRQSEEWLKN